MDLKNKIITGLVGIIIFMGVIGGGLVSKSKTKIDNQRSIIEEQQSQITHHKNKADEEYAQRLVAETDLKTFKAAFGDEIKEIKKTLEINSRDIKGLLRVSIVTTGSGVGRVDTVLLTEEGKSEVALEASDTTKWFDINAIISPTKFKYVYQVRDSITLVPYQDGRKIFVRGISANPNTHITGLQGVFIHEVEKKKRFGIGPSIQLGYDNQVRITVGISAQWSLIRL